jgi:hypothetical protein
MLPAATMFRLRIVIRIMIVCGTSRPPLVHHPPTYHLLKSQQRVSVSQSVLNRCSFTFIRAPGRLRAPNSLTFCFIDEIQKEDNDKGLSHSLSTTITMSLQATDLAIYLESGDTNPAFFPFEIYRLRSCTNHDRDEDNKYIVQESLKGLWCVEGKVHLVKFEPRKDLGAYYCLTKRDDMMAFRRLYAQLTLNITILYCFKITRSTSSSNNSQIHSIFYLTCKGFGTKCITAVYFRPIRQLPRGASACQGLASPSSCVGVDGSAIHQD